MLFCNSTESLMSWYHGSSQFIIIRLFVDFRNGWVIRTATKSFAVYAATSTEKQEWMAHINKCIEDLLRKSKLKYSFLQLEWIILQNSSMAQSQYVWVLMSLHFNRFCFVVCLGGKKAVEEHAAVWVPDSEASICMHCKKSQFTVLNRRVCNNLTVCDMCINFGTSSLALIFILLNLIYSTIVANVEQLFATHAPINAIFCLINPPSRSVCVWHAMTA